MCNKLLYIYSELVNVLDSSDTVTVSGGSFTVNIHGGLPKVYHPASDLDEDRGWLVGEEGGEGEREGEGNVSDDDDASSSPG